MSRTWIQLGAVGKPHGLRGAFFVAGRDDLLPASLQSVFLGESPETADSYQLSSCRMQSGRVQVTLQGIDSREAVEALRGSLLWCDRSDIPLDDRREYLWADLIGREVHDVTGRVVGICRKVQNFGASDILLLHSVDKQLWLDVPLVASYFDMNFTADAEPLRLVVNLETFDDAWYKNA